MAKNEEPSNGNKDMAILLAAVQSLQEENRTFKTEMADKIADLEEQIEKADMGGKAKLRMVELLYNTDDAHILELSSISGLQVRPVASVKTLARLRDPLVRAGKLSLPEIHVNNILRGRRSVEGKHLGRGNYIAVEEAGAVPEEESMKEIPLGGK